MSSRKTLLRNGMACAFVFVVAATIYAGQKPAQEKCPVTGKKLADLAAPVRVERDGFFFYVADANANLPADPEAIFKALAKNKDAAEPISQMCPIMGHRVNKALFVEKDGRRIYMCCGGCKAPINNRWPTMLEKVKAQAEVGDPQNMKAM